MKTRKLVLILAATGMTLVFASCSENVSSVEGTADFVTTELKSSEITSICGTCDFSETLTEDEIAGLKEMREEEKLAHEVYRAFYAKYNYRIFNNISKSENAHTSAVLNLVNGFWVNRPDTGC